MRALEQIRVSVIEFDVFRKYVVYTIAPPREALRKDFANLSAELRLKMTVVRIRRSLATMWCLRSYASDIPSHPTSFQTFMRWRGYALMCINARPVRRLFCDRTGEVLP